MSQIKINLKFRHDLNDSVDFVYKKNIINFKSIDQILKEKEKTQASININPVILAQQHLKEKLNKVELNFRKYHKLFNGDLSSTITMVNLVEIQSNLEFIFSIVAKKKKILENLVKINDQSCERYKFLCKKLAQDEIKMNDLYTRAIKQKSIIIASKI
ncbi:MAG TPA: hypothetical protein P5556_08880 [Candidatus Gastranaerophilales bacterium]|nr:hypothetical protein [Candidatus Gastranaerophilales bacterium]